MCRYIYTNACIHPHRYYPYARTLQGAAVFELYLLDGDWALNNANWQWLSASSFFYQVRINIYILY
jgi:hypothetical protein